MKYVPSIFFKMKYVPALRRSGVLAFLVLVDALSN